MKAFPACIKIFLKTVLWAAAVAVALVLVFLAVGVMTDFRPGGREPVYEYAGKWLCGSSGGYSGVAVPESGKIIPDTLKIVTWNIGYGGLGDDMDFFYDGGTRMRCSEERTRENLAAIVCELKSMDADIYLLQEVDEASRRSYMINELELLREAFPDYCLYFAYNYKSFFVPIPLSNPLGKVSSGVAILSRYRPEKVERLSYPSRFPFPVRNTHNTAYDTGGMRLQETDFLAGWADSLCREGAVVLVGGDWNQYPPGYVPSEEETCNPHFAVAPLDLSGLGSCGRVVYDTDEKTLRYLDRPFSEGPVQSVTDYFFISGGLHAGHAEVCGKAEVCGPAEVCGNSGFRYGDHRPVEVNIVL